MSLLTDEHISLYIHTYTYRDSEAQRHVHILMRQRGTETDRQRDRETERQRDRETERQRDREKERETDSESKCTSTNTF